MSEENPRATLADVREGVLLEAFRQDPDRVIRVLLAVASIPNGLPREHWEAWVRARVETE